MTEHIDAAETVRRLVIWPAPYLLAWAEACRASPFGPFGVSRGDRRRDD